MRDKRRDFVLRCVNLEDKLDTLFLEEPSNRVWACVCIDMLAKIIKSENNPASALLQIVEELNNKLREEWSSKNMEK